MNPQSAAPGSASNQQSAPKQATPTPVAPVPKSPELLAAEARTTELEARLAAADKKLRVNGIEVMKAVREKTELGAKLSSHDKMERALKGAGITPEELEAFKVNPRRVLEKVLGEKWYDRIIEERLNGGAPTADVLVSELQRTKEEIRAELRAEAEQEKVKAAKEQQEQAETARAQLATEAHTYFSKARADFPGLARYPAESIARALAQYIEQEFHRTGKVLTTQEAADAVEWQDVASRFVRDEDLPAQVIKKYEERFRKLTSKLGGGTVPVAGQKPAGQASRSTDAERRTLSNDLTATTPTAKRTPRTDEERMAAIMALDFDR